MSPFSVVGGSFDPAQSEWASDCFVVVHCVVASVCRNRVLVGVR